MPYDPNIHHRRSIRLKGYDYSQAGLYFITICVHDRACLYGSVGAPLVGAQNNTVQNDGAQNDCTKIDGGADNIIGWQQIGWQQGIAPTGVRNETDTQNNGIVQNETVFGNDDGRQTGQPQIGRSDIGRPQGHAPTGTRNDINQIDGSVQNVGSVQNDDAQNDAVQNNGIVQNGGDRNDDAPIMILNDAGKMVETEWLALKIRFPNIELHEYVVMPNHFHGILQIVDVSAVGKTVGDMMDAFKSITTVEFIHGVKQSGWKSFNGKLWQRDYWEHIIRDEQSYQNISGYIIDNPAKWKDDKFFNQ